MDMGQSEGFDRERVMTDTPAKSSEPPQFATLAGSYSDSFNAHLLEQYKLYVQSAGECQRAALDLQSLSSHLERGPGCRVRVRLYEFRSELVDARNSYRRVSSFGTVVSDHQVPMRI